MPRILGSAVVLGVATVVAASFLLQALISLALAIGLFRDVRHSGSLLAGCAFLTVAAVALTVAGVFPTDLSAPAGNPPRLSTRAGMVHQSAGTLSFLSRIVAFLSLSRAYRFDNRWQSLAPTAHRVAVAFLVLFFTFVVMVRWDFGGLAQRGAVAVGLLWMCLSGLRLRQTAAAEAEGGHQTEARRR